MLLLALRSLFFVAVILGYSTGVWRLINDYFRSEFNSYLQDEVKKNKYILVDPVKDGDSQHVDNKVAGSSPKEIIKESEVRRASGSITANRLVDELIVSFGRFFTTRNEREITIGDRKEKQQNQQQTNPPPEAAITDKLQQQQQRQQQQQEPTDNTHHQDPPGGERTPKEDAIIESDKFVGSYSSSPSHQAVGKDGTDNKSQDDDEAAAAAAEDDEEEKWINYWKNRGQRLVDTTQADDGGYCGAEGDMKGLAMDACGT